MLLLAVFCAAAAGTDSSLESQLRAVIADGSALATSRQQLQAGQQQLLLQKQSLDALGDDIDKRQAAMNDQVEAHNEQVNSQEDALQHNRAECNADAVSTAGNSGAGAFGMPQGIHANDPNKVNTCNAKIVALNS
ncbi:MAG TPA: hypothetical protein VGS99_03855, partial [Gammaproteobacteria bacterium]|nr:hypothetical protein [Gammaproteobacteria bacterium]